MSSTSTTLRVPDGALVVVVAASTDPGIAAVQRAFEGFEVVAAETAIQRRARVGGARAQQRAVIAIVLDYAPPRPAMKVVRTEGFQQVIVISAPDEIAALAIEREMPLVDRRHDRGPFDIIGDVHGCHAELVALLAKLGYSVDPQRNVVTPPDGRKAVFVGDLIDRGPAIGATLELAMAMVKDGVALCVPGNHEVKLAKHLSGREVRIGKGLALTLADLAERPLEFARDVEAFINALPHHLVLDGGALVVAHAGLAERHHGRDTRRVKDLALYGEATGERDSNGYPVRADWARDYRGAATVVYGHTVSDDAAWVNGTLCVDTGCVFGGHLTALRYPEREVVQIPAAREYFDPN